MNRRDNTTLQQAARRIGFLSVQDSKIRLEHLIERLNSPTLRIPTEEPEADGLHGWREVDVSECKVELRQLVDQWIVNKKHFDAVLALNSDLKECSQTCKAMLMPDRAGKVQVAFMPRRIARVTGPRNEALLLFTNLLVNPLSEKLSGPCMRCDSYFVNRTSRRRVYCSKKCSSAVTSGKRNEAKRSAERDEKLRRARIGIERWRKSRTKDWKTFVCAGAPGISKKWLTRAVNDGLLTPP